MGDGGFVIYDGAEPKEKKKISIDKEIRSIAYNEEYLAFVLADEGSSGSELRFYDYSGDEVVSKEFEGDYSNMKIDDGQVILLMVRARASLQKAVFTGLKVLWGQISKTCLS